MEVKKVLLLMKLIVNCNCYNTNIPDKGVTI